MWIDPHNSQSHLGLTVYCIYENKRINIVSGLSGLTEPHNTDYLVEVINEMIEQ